MDINEMKWEFPSSQKEVLAAFKGGSTLCAGGTWLLKRDLSKIEKMVDLNGALEEKITIDDGIVKIGAMARFSQVIEYLGRDSLIVKSLTSSASTPLRNHITIGGSIAAFPMWSNVIGPLVAHEAEVVIFDGEPRAIPIEQYLADNERTQRLILGVKFLEKGWKSYFYSAKRTNFDYSSFNISILADIKGDEIGDCRIIVVGCKNKFKRLTEIEKILRDKPISKINLIGIGKKTDIKFGKKPLGTPEYLRKLFEIELERGLAKILKG